MTASGVEPAELCNSPAPMPVGWRLQAGISRLRCPALVIGHVEIAGELRPLCRIHTMELARALLELGFDIELAGGRTAAELVGRLDKRVVEQLERRRVRAAMR